MDGSALVAEIEAALVARVSHRDRALGVERIVGADDERVTCSSVRSPSGTRGALAWLSR